MQVSQVSECPDRPYCSANYSAGYGSASSCISNDQSTYCPEMGRLCETNAETCSTTQDEPEPTQSAHSTAEDFAWRRAARRTIGTGPKRGKQEVRTLPRGVRLPWSIAQSKQIPRLQWICFDITVGIDSCFEA